MHILFLGDIVGKPGREAVSSLLPGFREEWEIDLVVANGENVAGGFGITPPLMYELFDAGVDVFTTGNHVWDKKEILDVVDKEERFLRPANFPPGSPGKGLGIYDVGGFKVAVLNLIGRVFISPSDCPFQVGTREVDRALRTTPIVIVDFHAEATSEKLALGWLLKNKASAVIGTHTHVQTADERICPEKSAYISDVGMVGPYNSVLGLDPENVLKRFFYGLPVGLELAAGEVVVNGVFLKVDPENGQALEFRRVFHLY